MLYRYKAHVDSVYDGDTITVTIDLGFKVQLVKAKLRLLGVDTPELRGGTELTKKAGYEARDFVRDLCLGKDVLIHSVKKGKYGRFLAHVWTIEDGKPSEKSINELLIEKGLAREYMT